MRGLQPAGATRVTLDVIIPSSRGLTPEKWKQTATLCPLDWPSNYSLLRLWHVPKDLHQFVDQLNQQLNHRHMFSRWELTMRSLRVESSSSFRLTTSLKLHCDPSLMASACLLPPAHSFCWALSARLVVLYLAGPCGSSFCVVLVCPLGVACFCFVGFVWFRCVVCPWLVFCVLLLVASPHAILVRYACVICFHLHYSGLYHNWTCVSVRRLDRFTCASDFHRFTMSLLLCYCVTIRRVLR